ncbi:MAG: hypothetical protein ABR502_00900 [Chitinophagaceae bacterium]
MIKYFIVLFVVFSHFLSLAQSDTTELSIESYKPDVKEHHFKLGDSLISVFTTDYDSTAPLAFISLHSNETTAIEAVDTFLLENCGVFVQLENNAERTIDFTYKDKRYEFDPNRIFTKAGIIATLKAHKNYSAEVVPQIQRFAAFLLQRWAYAKTFIAVHNNTDDQFSVLSYKKGGSFYSDAKAVHQNKEMDIDDFFITTDPKIYQKLKQKNFNVVLQNNQKAKDDGSLSIYYGRHGRSYVNIEAEHGHYKEQLQMLQVLDEILLEMSDNAALRGVK